MSVQAIQASDTVPGDVLFDADVDVEPEPVEWVLLWDSKHRAWWRANGNGYAADVNQAGRFPRNSSYYQYAARLVDREVFEIPAKAAYEIVATALTRVAQTVDLWAANAEARGEGTGKPS